MSMNSAVCNTMNFSEYFMSLQEGFDESLQEQYEIELPEDTSGFSESDVFGVDKMDPPSEEGFEAARNAANAFTNASDGENTDVNMNMNIALPKDTSGFNEEFVFDEGDGVTCDGGECVDPNTIPAVPSEEDQFSDPDEDDEAVVGSVSDAELAANDDDIVGESATGWEDLF